MRILQNDRGDIFDRVPIEDAENYVRERLASGGFKNLKKQCDNTDLHP